ncbi:MAG: hypothetical protein JXQ29_15665 [Planctomycetes bacterium]|nr:hypothetical protein [Planctomycetota bacterium]
MNLPQRRSLRTVAGTLVAAALTAILVACSARPAQPDPTTAPEADRHPSILVPIYFYHGYSVGHENRTSGLQVSRDGGRTFTAAAWKELITNSVAVDPSGCWIYLACGNGVLVSRDAGQTWRLTGGWRMTEVQRVAIDRRDPRRALAATAYGVFAYADADNPAGAWEARPSEHFRYSTDVRQDAAEPDTIWVASDRGVFVSRDLGRRFEPALAGVDVRRIWQDPRDPRRLFAATDGRGLMATVDGGRTWQRVEGLPDIVLCIEEHPARPGVLLAGTLEGLFLRDPATDRWTCAREGLPDGFCVYGVAVDPADPDHLFAAGNDGLFERRGSDGAWRQAAFPDSLIHDIGVAHLARPRRDALSTEPGTPLTLARGTGESAAAAPEFAARREHLLAHFRDRPRPEKPWNGWTDALVRVDRGETDAAFWSALRDELAHPGHSMFYTMPLIAFHLHGGERVPADVRDRIRTLLTEVPIYRGDTENHWVMHYAVLLLAAETWPETPAARWYMGRDTSALHAEARGWLEHWARLAATKGQGEFDSPNYLFMYVTPMLLLHDFARTESVQQLAHMMLDLLLADYLAESLRGAWCGGHSRIIDEEVERTVHNRVSVFHWLYAGGIEWPAEIHGWTYYAARSSYRPPAVLEAIANRRETPFVHTELKRVRNVMRFGAELNPPVHKYDFLTPLYGMGSLQGGILQPLQQHTWDVTWLGSAENATLFSVHPAVSARELAMFFPEHPRDITRIISRQKGVYLSPDKWISASAHEQVFQHERVLLALYQVPPGESFPHVNLYWPSCLERTRRDGWWFGQDGDFFLACYPCREGDWTDLETRQRFRCPADRAGFVVVARPVGGDPAEPVTFESFQQSVLAGSRPELTGEGDQFALSFRSAGGPEYRKVWGEAAGRIDGQPVSFPAEWLFRGPFLTSRAGSGVVTLTDGRTRRVLDFNDFSIRETP